MLTRGWLANSFILLLFSCLAISAPKKTGFYKGLVDCGAATAWPHYLVFYPTNTLCNVSLKFTRTSTAGESERGTIVYKVGSQVYNGTYRYDGSSNLIDFPGKQYLYYRGVYIYTASNGQRYASIEFSTSNLPVALWESEEVDNPGQGEETDLSKLKLALSQFIIDSRIFSISMMQDLSSYESVNPRLRQVTAQIDSFKKCVFEDKLSLKTCLPIYKKGSSEWELFVPEFYEVHAKQGLEEAKRHFSIIAKEFEVVRGHLKDDLR